MKEFIIDSHKGATDIIPIFAGEQVCQPSHSFGPAMREYYLIHFVLSGKGVILDSRGRHTISAGELFIIRPDEVTTYTADRDEPWHYIWLSFRGRRAEEAFRNAPTRLPSPDGTAEKLRELITLEEAGADIYTSFIYELIHRLFSGGGSEISAASRVKRYINYSYMECIGAQEIAEKFGFERSYLFRIFKARYGVGVKEYLTAVRMEHAAQFLKSGQNVATVSSMVGYRDVFNFSKAFKKYYGISPAKYKVKDGR